MAAHLCFLGTGFGALADKSQEGSAADAIQSCINDAVNRARIQPDGQVATKKQSPMARCQEKALGAGRADEAISSCTTAIESSAQSSPERARGLAFRAIAYVAKAHEVLGDKASPDEALAGVYDRAHDDAFNALAIGPKVPEVLLALGMLCEFRAADGESPKEQEIAKTGIDFLTQGIQLKPGARMLEDMLEMRGYTYRILKKYDLAVQDFSETIKLDPKAGPAFYWRGWIEKQTGNSAAAAADLRMAQKLDPNDPDMANY
jgi:tetratricopeptide (TPR) repeat protein